MGWFDDDDEQQAPKAAPMGPPASAARDPVVRDYLQKKYMQAADDSDVRAAQGDAKNSAALAMALQGIGQIATAGSVSRGGKGIDSGAFRPIADAGQQRVVDARQARKDRMDSVLAEDHMQQQGVERERAGQEYAHKEGAWKREEADRAEDDKVDTPEAKSMQGLAGKMTGQDPGAYANMSPKQLKKMLPSLEHLYKIDQDAKNRADARAATAAGSWQTAPTPDEAGNVIAINTKTGQQKVLYAAGKKPKDATDAQNKAAGFAKRAEAANKIAEFYEAPDSGYNPASRWKAVRGGVPLFDIRNDQDRAYDQAKRDFVTANLRPESGAAIGKDEMASEIAKYFPEGGDPPFVILQKAESRKRALESLKNESGPGYKGVGDVAVTLPQKKKPVDAGTAYAAPAEGNALTGETSPADLQEAMRQRANGNSVVPKGMTSIRAPDGSVKAVPDDQVAKYVRKGGEVVP